jgi:hypothetical protein
MSLINSLRALVRSRQHDRIPRSLPRRSCKPRIGAYVINVPQGVRLVVQAGMTDELWQWLLDHGWRVDTHRPDRRQYRDIPASLVTRLIDSDPERRAWLMADAISAAQSRPAPVVRRPIP